MGCVSCTGYMYASRVISGNEWLNRGGGISGVFVSVCLYVWFIQRGES